MEFTQLKKYLPYLYANDKAQDLIVLETLYSLYKPVDLDLFKVMLIDANISKFFKKELKKKLKIKLDNSMIIMSINQLNPEVNKYLLNLKK